MGPLWNPSLTPFCHENMETKESCQKLAIRIYFKITVFSLPQQQLLVILRRTTQLFYHRRVSKTKHYGTPRIKMARLRVHFIKEDNDFIQFDNLMLNRITSTTLPSELVSHDDFVTDINGHDVRGNNAKKIKRLISQRANGKPMFIEFLKGGYDHNHPWLDPEFEVRRLF